jgi:hypothetical protein
MVVGRPSFVSYLRRPISLLNCLRRGQKKRQSREKLRSYVSTYSTAEQLEDRTLLAGASLVNIEPNIDLSLTDGEIYNQAPSELTFKFTPGQQINPDTLGAIQIVRSGLDGTFTDGNEVPITPGYIGIGENPNEVILRFAESLPDDHYQITILGTGANPLLNQNDEAFQDGVDQVIDFELDLGAKVVAVVPQPVSGGGTGSLTQAKDQIDVYFNADTLDQASAENVQFYQLIDTSSNTLINPDSVIYDSATNKATLTFAADIADGTYHLRIGESNTPDFTTANVVAVGDVNSSFDEADANADLGVLGTQTIQVNGEIQPQSVLQPQLPGGNDEPGHREITIEQHIESNATGTTPSAPSAIPTIQFYFPDFYGNDLYGNPLYNEITENQKQRTREIYELYSFLTGIEVQETANSGTAIVTGDIRVLDPGTPPLAVGGIAGGGMAIMNGALDWGDSPYGGGWFGTAFHEIGHTLGLGHSYDLPSVMGSSGGDVGGTVAGEPIFPSNYDITHINRIHPALANDIDLHKFELATAGRFTAEITADRLPTKSFLDSVLTLYRETSPGVREIIARNDDFFGEDAFLDLELEAGNYYLAVTSVGNIDFDPNVADSGYGGRTDGLYSLDINFTPDPMANTFMVDSTGVALDGDADGTPGGVFDFWFQSGETIFVDKATQSAGPADGSLSNPYANIDDALLAAGNSATAKIVRIVGNGGVDGDISTLADNDAYLVGLTDSFQPLEDGATFNIPKDVTVMVDEGVIIKLQRANIDVGSNNLQDDRSQGALQILGTTENQVYLTAFGNDAIGGDDDGLSDGANPGDWGGIVFRDDSGLEDQGIFLNSVNNANISYGGGSVFVNSVQQVFSAIHAESARPTIWQNTIAFSADSAISADPRSFEDSQFTNGSFVMDRHGLEIFDNHIANNSVNGLFVRINTPYGSTINKLDVPAIFNDKITHVITENLQIYGAPGGQMDESGNPTINGRLKIDPGTVIKLSGARIEAERGSAQLIAEGTEANPIIFTSLSDDRYGAGTTFDTSNDGFDTSDPANLPYGPGNWGGIIFNAASSGSIDHALITNAGGLIPIEGGFANFNAIEVHQAEFRISNSILENNASGQTGSSRNGRGSNDDATIFVRGAQPIIVDNIFRDNEGTVVSIDANSLNYKFKGDYGRSTGFTEAYTQYTDNHGALVRLNRMENNGLNGMEVREALLDTETVWDDTDIVHILRGEIQVLQHHTFSGIRLQSNLDEGLVVKLDGADAGFTADGVPLDIEDRIGGTVQIIGQPGFPVILTSLADDTAGASFTPAGLPQTDTNNDGDASTPSAGDWRSIRLDRYSNDRNVVERFETEGNNTGGVDTNSNPGFAQNLGILAPDEISGDENRALGFNVHGNISADAPDDVDVYSFTGTAGTRIWIDIDRTSSALDTMVELVDLYGNVLARSLNSFDDLTLSGLAEPLLQDDYLLGDFYSQNINDAGFSVVLPGPAGATGTFFIRVRSQPVAGDEANLEGGQTSGQYQLQVRLRQVDEKPGSTVRYADIRYPTNGVEVLGQPAHSPLLGESSEKTANNESIDNAQGLGNLLTSDRNTLSVSGSLSNGSDVDWYTFEMGYDLVQVIGGRSDGGKTFAAIFDIDYADGLSRGDTTLSVFDDQGRLILVSRDSDIQDDQADGDTENLAAGSFGKLDPYIGTVQLPSATPGSTFRYHVAISSNARLPQALNATFVSGALNSQIRLEPVSSVQRIVEDHIGFSGYTSGNSLAGSTYVVPPTTSSIFDISDEISLSTNVTAFTLEDVNLYVSQNNRLRIVDAYDGYIIDEIDGIDLSTIPTSILNSLLPPGVSASDLRSINIGALSTGSNDNTSDITIRSDGQLYSYESLTGNRNGTAGRFRELDPGNASTISSTNDGIPDLPTTGTPDPVDITTSSVGALAFQRTDVATYNLFYAVDDPGGFTTLYQANPSTGASGQDRLNSQGNDSGNTFTVLGDITGVGQITGMSFRGINATSSQSQLFAVTDTNQFVTINQSGGTRRDVTSFTSIDLSGQIDGTLQGLTAAPQNLNNGAFRNFLFAITDSGNLYCIDPSDGSILTTVNDPVLGTIDIFKGGADHMFVGETGITGLAFSPLDFNLWHPTFRRNTDSGHGINNTFDQTRTDVGGNDRDTFPNGLQQSESQGGASFYFGFEEWLQNNSSTNDYIDYVSNAQYGVLSSNFQRDLSSNPDIGDNYNIAGGARGSLESGSFSLDGYESTDLPTLYFNYFLETQSANSITGGMRDSVRVFIFDSTLGAGGDWVQLATNNSTLAPATNPDAGELSSYLTASQREGVGNDNQQVQELFDNTGVWRQARIDLSEFVGRSDLRLRFDFATSGTFSSSLSSDNTPNDGDDTIDQMQGDHTGNILSNQQAQNNNFEGFYIDDIIIGFAERGEMVTGAQADQTAFFNLPQNPTFGAPTQLLSGGYQLEIRRGTEYAAPPNGQLPDLTISTQFDTNDRLIREVEATVPSDFLNGQQGDRNLARQQGHISIESNSISSASEYGINIDAGQRESVAAGPNGGVSARSQAGGVINVPELNDFFNGGLGFAPGVTIQNNVVTEFTNGLGGIRVSGDANSSTQNNPAAVSYTKVVNNTLSGANVTVTQSSAQIDVVFIIDISGSMGPAIANVQAQLLNFNSQMQAAGIDAQYGLVLMPSPVGFSDDPTQVQDIVDFATFTAPGSPFLTIPITGATERGSDAILEALNLFDPDAGPTTFNYRPGSRIVPILLTNEDDDSTTQAAIDAQAALLSTNSLFYAIADPLFFNTASTYGTFATSTGGQLFDINNFLLDPTNFFNTMTADLIGQIAVGAAGQGILVENYATTTILNNIVANTSTAIDLQSSGGIPNVVGANVFKGNTAIGTAGTNSIQLGANDPLFVNPSKGNYYLADNSQAIDSSLNSLADRPDFVNVKDSIGMPNSDIFAPTYDAFGQLRVDDPTQTPPPGLGSNIFKDRGAIERADFVGPTAIISLPEDNDVDGVDQNSDPNAVYITNPELFTTMIVKLKDSGIGIDDSLVNSLQFTLTARTSTSTRTLEEGLDYIFSYNRNTDEVIFTSIAGVFGMDTLYTIDVDNSTTNAVKDLAGNVLQPNQTDGSTSFTILVSDGVNAPPINHFDATPIPDSPNVTVTTDPGFSVVFSAANGNALTVTDQDSFLGTQGIPTSPATDGMVTVTLSTLMTEGKLAAGPNTSNVTINLTDDGTSYFLEITGLIEDVNTALDGVSWTPLSTPTDGSTFAGATASLTMTTDDNGNFFGDPSQTDTDVIDIVVTALPEVFFNTPTYSLNEDGTTTVTVELERDKIGLATTVDLLFGAGDTEGIDFTTPPPAQVTFAANELTAEVVFTIFNDDIVELDEQFTLTIDTVDNGTKTDGLIDDGLGGTLTVYDQTTITILDNDTATITFVETDLTVAEDVATGYVEYTVHISNAVENDVQFFVTSADGTSLVVDNASDENTDDDYTSVNELVTFTNSITPAADQTFQVFITDDNKLELDEIFNLYMNSLTAGGLESKITLGSPVSNPAQVTITDEDTAVISFVSDDLNVTEDDGATVTFNIQIDDGSGGAITLAKDVSFSVSTADGTSSVDRNATVADNDYTAKTEQFTFAGSADADLVTGIQNFVITINNDDKLELDEVFNVFMSQLAANGLDSKITLSHPITEPDSNNWAQATITDELDTANITFLNSSITVNEQAGAIALLTVQIDKAIAENVSFDLFTQDGTATDELIDDDYSSDRQTFTFLGTPDTDVVPGVKTFVVNITNDDKLELDEIFNVLMDSLSANGLDSRINLDGPADVTIKDLDTAFISFVNNDVFVDEEAGSVTFNVYISNAIAVDVGFDLTTKDGTPPLPAGSGIATDESLDDDYKFKTQSFTFTGTPDTDNVPSAQAFTVTITPDEKVELDELFNVFIDNLNANGLDSRITLGADATGIIRNNDSAIITVDPVISGGVNEGSGTGTTNITFNVNISKAIDTNVSFFLSTLDNTATVADNDYIPVLNQLYTFLGSPNSDVVPGQQTFTVQIAQDKKVELDELFNVIATNLNASGRNVTLGLPAAGTIINDDSATVTINNVSKLESEGNFVFTATLSNPVDSNVSVEVYTQHGTGLVTDSDYNAVDPLAPIILNFTPNGALTQNFTITVNDDNLVEGDEFFSTILANLDAALRNVSIINGTDQGHIRDNDSAKLSITPVIDTENNSPFQFLVQLSNPVDVAITVDASTIDGTATSPNDYQGISGQTLTFGPGVTQVPLNITVFNDIFTESPETFEVILDNLVPNGRAVFLTSVESLSSVATSDAAVAVDVVGNYAYVADRDGGLQIYNIANPAAPFHVGEFDFNNQGIAQAIDVVGNLAYLAVGEAGLQIINIANPAAPVFVGSIATPARARGVQVIGNLAYVADDSGNGGGLQIIDVTNPAAPSILGSFGVSTPGGLAGGVEVIGNVAYLTDGNNGLQIVNVTDSSNPTLIKNVLTPGGAAIGLDVVGNYAFVANREGGLQVIDISTPATASIVGTLNTPGVATGVQVDGNFAYVADGATGLQVVDITNPTSPILINTFDTPSSARSLFVNGTLAFVADTFSGLQILEFFPSTTATGTILDPSGPPLTGTASPNTTISTSIVKSQTTTDANGETGSVPESEDWVDEWDSFWVEVWGTTTDGSGITGGSFDLEYNTDFFTATAIEFGSAFGNSTSSSIDDQTGIVSGISGQNGVGTLGSSKQVLLARVKFESLADDGVAIDTVAGFLGPHNLGIRVINAELDVAGTGAVTASVATAPTTDLWAVPFDLDDSGVVDFKDLLKFSSFYGTSVVNASSGLAWSLDFDKSGQINFKDLTFLATNYNRSKASGQSIIFPPNFPQEWYGSSITTDGDDSLNDLINAAVDEWKTATGNQDLSVQVVVTDLGGQQLGEGHILELDENGIPVKGRVYIDDDAAGLGWYSSIEGLSFDSNGEAISGSAADGHYDLYTVLLHEIGHAAGFTTGYSAYADHVETSGSGQVQFVSWDLIAPLTDDGLHIDENFYPDDLMGEFLDPSVRKSISTLDVRILQAAYADAAGAVISPLSAPLTGAGLDPTPLMTSAPVVDAPAATTRTKQSVGVAPAPALEPASEPTTVETASDWGYTSLTVQDSVLNLDQSSGLDQLVGSLLDNSYETDQLLTNDFKSLESDGYDLGFEFEDNQDLNAGFELETAGEEVDDLFADWSGPLI